MNKDIVIINKETRDILAIITNKDLKNSQVVAIDGMDIIEVDNRQSYIVGGRNNGKY